MKKAILPLLAVVIIGMSFKAGPKKEFTPPGTVRINDTLYADDCELTNFSWLEYTWSICNTYGHDSKEYKAALPDTTVWRDKNAYNEPYVKFYFRHPAYRDFPVVGITYEQAVAYCKWRTERVRSYLTIKKDFKNQNFEYRLPTKAEWEYLANSSINFLAKNGKNEKGEAQLNIIDITSANKPTDGNAYPDVTTTVTSYHPNQFGIYNMLGNVAEMVQEKNVSKGGGWRNKLEDCRPGKDHEYTSPNAWTGFRCVCVVRKG